MENMEKQMLPCCWTVRSGIDGGDGGPGFDGWISPGTSGKDVLIGDGGSAGMDYDI